MKALMVAATTMCVAGVVAAGHGLVITVACLGLAAYGLRIVVRW